jgi:hypothetical protein
MVQVTFEIPDTALALFYLYVGHAMEEAEPEGSGGASGQDVSVLHDWGTDHRDDEVAQMAWRKFSPRAQAVFSLLMDNPGIALSADDIASKIGLSNGRHGLAGIVAWPSRQCAELGLAPPFRFDGPAAPGETGSYWMDAEAAALFISARSEYQARLGRPAQA